MTRPHTNRKTRCDSKLGNLPRRRRNAIAAWCEHRTLEEGVAWLKSEHNITLSDTALANWLYKHQETSTLALFAGNTRRLSPHPEGCVEGHALSCPSPRSSTRNPTSTLANTPTH